MGKENRSSVIKSAFPQTIPVLTGYIFLGMAYGIVMKSAGFNLLYPILISIFVYGGSLQFAAVSMLCSAFAPVQTFVVALAVQARHLFYGVSMLPKYSQKALKSFYLYLPCPTKHSLFVTAHSLHRGLTKPTLCCG